MKKQWYLYLLLGGLIFTACKNDDDNNEVSQSQQNELDDAAIIDYLKDHYFESERGRIEAFDEDDETDDDYASLYSLGNQLSSGVWVVKRPEVEANGRKVVNNATDSILMSYHSQLFKSNDGSGDFKTYQPVSDYSSTINSSGSPQWDPRFYFTNVEVLNLPESVKHEHFEIEGFLEGLKEFNATDNNGTELYNFQGVIIVPSRLAFARDFVYSNGRLDYTFRNYSFIFNIELHQVVDRDVE